MTRVNCGIHAKTIGRRPRVRRSFVFLIAWSISCSIGWTSLAGSDAGSAEDLVSLPPHPDEVDWPTARWEEGELPEGLDEAAFEQAIESLFAPNGRGGFSDTRAVLFVRGGKIVFERYADGFGPESRFQSWSMAKSVTNAFIGLLVGDGALELDARAPVELWRGADDPRREITLRHLLQMRSGLANADGFGAEDPTETFVAQVLFGDGSLAPAAYAADVPLEHPVGTHWAYSTGASIVIASIAGDAVGDGREATLRFLRQRLFDPLGMQSAQPEFAQSGEFLGGAFVHATARDWARFGYLYLRDGVWDSKRILPEGWVDFSRTASPAENNGVHGAHFWVNRPPTENQWVQLPGLPDSAFHAEGANFQMVAIVPTMDLVAVRLGETQAHDFQEYRKRFARAIAEFPEAEASVQAGSVASVEISP